MHVHDMMRLINSEFKHNSTIIHHKSKLHQRTKIMNGSHGMCHRLNITLLSGFLNHEKPCDSHQDTQRNRSVRCANFPECGSVHVGEGGKQVKAHSK